MRCQLNNSFVTLHWLFMNILLYREVISTFNLFLYNSTKEVNSMETVYVAGGCLWGVQAFFKTIPGIISTEAGSANGKTQTLDGNYDGYAECVKLTYDPEVLTIYKIMEYLFEVIDPYSVNKQGHDVGKKYRTGFYSKDDQHLQEAKDFINQREDCFKIKVEV